MKKIITLLFILSWILFYWNIYADNMFACTEEYAPVCAQPPMPDCPEWMACIQVMPQPATYSNACVAKSYNAELLYEWECSTWYIDYSDTSRKMHPSWDLNRDWINDCEYDWTCDDSIDYTLPRTYKSSEDFLSHEWHLCVSATDWCNSIQIMNWNLWASTLMWCEDIYWENWEEKWSCNSYIDELNNEILDNYWNVVPNSCEAWFDGCNNCFVSEDWNLACTKMFCENPSQAYCKSYKNDVVEDEFNDVVFCTMEYAPVCWKDWNTYWNSCVATSQNNVEINYNWVCLNRVEELQIKRWFEKALNSILFNKDYYYRVNFVENIVEKTEKILLNSTFWEKTYSKFSYLGNVLNNYIVEIYSEFINKNIANISPVSPVLWWNWYVTNIYYNWKFATIDYEDWHIAETVTIELYFENWKLKFK